LEVHYEEVFPMAQNEDIRDCDEELKLPEGAKILTEEEMLRIYGGCKVDDD